MHICLMCNSCKYIHFSRTIFMTLYSWCICYVGALTTKHANIVFDVM